MLELLVVMFAFLASIFLQAFMVNVPVGEAKVDCDINIEDVINRHGKIISFEDCDYPDDDYVDDMLLPKHESVSVEIAHKHSKHRKYKDRLYDKRCLGQQPKYKNRVWSRKYGS